MLEVHASWELTSVLMTFAALLSLLIVGKGRYGCKQLPAFGIALVDWGDPAQADTRNSTAHGHL